MTVTTDQAARVSLAKGAPWAFVIALALFTGIAVYSFMQEAGPNWTAVAIAVAMIPAAIISYLVCGLVNSLLTENEDLHRQLRTTSRH